MCVRWHHGGAGESVAACVGCGGSLDLKGERAETKDKVGSQASRQLGKVRVWAFECSHVGALCLHDRGARRLRGVEP